MSTVHPRFLDLDEINHKYEYRNGDLYWKHCRFKKQIGTKAGTLREDGYRMVSLNKKPVLAHRVIFLMHHGYAPDVVDHINQDQTDNRIENLRASDRSQNAHNRKPNSTNKSGVSGVNWHSTQKKWRAYIVVGRKTINLGTFSEKDSAISARRAAQIRFGLYDQILSDLCV